jgi:uncharacterized SAM-binding protein YcdF (DUF218 family)
MGHPGAVLLLLRPVRLALALVVLLPVLVVGGTAARVWWTARQDSRPVSDAIVVLGASQYDGRPSSVFEARLRHAADLFDQGVAPRVITLGGSQPGDRFTEAVAGEEFLVSEGVPRKRVLAVGEGSDTLESLEAYERVAEERGWDSAVLVTDPWHSLRARTMARDLGVEAESSPTRSGPIVQTRGTQLRYIARETAALLLYELTGHSLSQTQLGAQAAG